MRCINWSFEELFHTQHKGTGALNCIQIQQKSTETRPPGPSGTPAWDLLAVLTRAPPHQAVRTYLSRWARTSQSWLTSARCLCGFPSSTPLRRLRYESRFPSDAVSPVPVQKDKIAESKQFRYSHAPSSLKISVKRNTRIKGYIFEIFSLPKVKLQGRSWCGVKVVVFNTLLLCLHFTFTLLFNSDTGLLTW